MEQQPFSKHRKDHFPCLCCLNRTKLPGLAFCHVCRSKEEKRRNHARTDGDNEGLKQLTGAGKARGRQTKKGEKEPERQTRQRHTKNSLKDVETILAQPHHLSIAKGIGKGSE